MAYGDGDAEGAWDGQAQGRSGGAVDLRDVAALWPAFRTAPAPAPPEPSLERAMLRAATMGAAEYARARAALARHVARIEAHSAAAWSDMLGFEVPLPPPAAPALMEEEEEDEEERVGSAEAAGVGKSTVTGAGAGEGAGKFVGASAPIAGSNPVVAETRRKVAVILNGHFRSFDRTAPFWRRALEGLDATFCIHSWDVRDSSTVTWNRPTGAPPAPALGAAELGLLREFDAHARIGTQLWSAEDQLPSSVRGPAPIKALKYAYEGIAACALEVEKARAAGAEYDMVVLSRLDILVRVPLARLAPPARGEVVFGARPDERMLHNVASVDLLRAVHPDDLHLVAQGVPRELEAWRTDAARFKFGEEPATAIYFSDFKKQTVAWQWGPCTFYVLRAAVLDC